MFLKEQQSKKPFVCLLQFFNYRVINLVTILLRKFAFAFLRFYLDIFTNC